MPIRSELCRLDTPSGVWTLCCSKQMTSIHATVHDRDRPHRRLWHGWVPFESTRSSDLRASIAWRESQVVVRYRQRRNKFEISYSLRLEVTPEAPVVRPSPTPRAGVGSAHEPPAVLERIARNPMLEPVAEHAWESLSVFNAAAVRLGDRVHLLYRAIGPDGLSVLGHAASDDGVQVNERSAQPIFTDGKTLAEYGQPDAQVCERFQSGISTFGCEDPRITPIDDRLYVTYTAFDGRHPPGVGLTSIAIDDLAAGRWNWRQPVLISEPHQAHKNWVLFPQRIDGRFALLHGISPTMQIDFFDDLDFVESYRVRSRYSCSGQDGCWDNRIRGVGPPPIRTDAGWLVLYHAMDQRDPGRYKLGAMLLDLDCPFRILGRLPHPLLEPDARYENEGFKAGVIYACGAVVIGGRLHVYYGGADSVVCCATVALDRLLGQLQPMRVRTTRRRERRQTRALAAT